MEKFVIIDGNSLINRAFYGIPMLTSLSGKPCNAVYGFLNMMLSVVTKQNPKYLVVVFDAGKHTFRHNLYAEYKGTRDKMPEDLAVQLPMLKKVLRSMGITILEKAEIEADDIIGTLTRKFHEQFILVSGDRDLLQLINDNTSVWLTQKGITQVKEVDTVMLKAEYGIEPYQVIELKGLMGDSSDNIPGVPGVGKKTAEKLIADYQNINNIYDHIEELSGKLKDRMIEHKDLCYLSKELATIKLDVELDVLLDQCTYNIPFGAETIALLKEMDFKSILNRTELFDTSDNVPVQNTINADTIEISSYQHFMDMACKIGSSMSIVSQDLSFNLGVGDNEYLLYKNGQLFNECLPILKVILENAEIEKVGFDVKELMHEMRYYDINIKNYFDVSIAIYIANEMDAEITLKDALKLNGITSEAYAQSLLRLKEIYMNQLIDNLGLNLYHKIESPLVEVLYAMECAGIAIDTSQIYTLSKQYHDELRGLQEKIWELTGLEFNINSPKQLQEVLFDKLNLQYKGKKGTSIEVLNAISNQHEAVELVIRYRKISKLVSTYLDGMLQYVSDDQKVHTKFMQRTTSTGRLSSREPNLQNLPIRDDEGKALRKMFKSSFENGSLVSADYNQIELRLMANFSEDANMISDYLSGKDIHTATAAKIFSVDTSEVTSQMRRIAKSVNFGIIYGISAYGLSQNIHSTTKEASEFINKYMEIYPQVKVYGEQCIAKAKETGYSTTLMGRVRHIRDINSSNHVMRGFAERTAKNMPLQGSASDIIKLAMIKVYNKMKSLDMKSKLILQIHDELVVDCYPGESDIVKRVLKEEMESVVDLTVPLIVEVSEGVTLYDAK